MNLQPQQQDPMISLSLSLTAINYILAIANERPHKESRGLIDTLTEQAQVGMKPPAPVDSPWVEHVGVNDAPIGY